MSLRAKFLFLLVPIPALCLALLLYFSTSTFLSYKTADVFENQLQLLSFAQVLLSKSEATAPSTRFQEIFQQDGLESLIAADGAGKIRFAARQELVGKSAADVIGSLSVEKAKSQEAQEGSFEARGPDNKKVLVSFLNLPFGGERLHLFLHRSKAAAGRASLLFFFKGLATFVGFLAFAIIVSILLADLFTKSLTQITSAMKAFGTAAPTVTVPAFAFREIRDMTRAFGEMRTRVITVLGEQKQAAESEAESRLARKLRGRFFSAPSADFSGTKVETFYEAAKTPQAAWFFHFERESKAVFLMADIRGEGLDIAVMTAVCRSVMSILSERFTGVDQAMQFLNETVHDSAPKGTAVTCCVASLDRNSGELQWSNAGQPPPIVVAGVTRELKTEDCRILMGSSGSRLGLEREYQFSQETTTLADGDSLIMMSAGLGSLRNAKEESFGETRLIPALCEAPNQSDRSPKSLINTIKGAANEHRAGADLERDICCLVLKWRKQT